MIKLIVTDIDGTLVEEGSVEMNPEYFEQIRRLTDAGVTFVVASGRHMSSIVSAFEPVLDCIWIISQNGAVISHDGKSQVLHPIPKEWVKDLWKEISQRDKMDSIIDTAEKTYCPMEDSIMYHIVKDIYGYTIEETGGWDQIPDKDISMVTLYHPDCCEDVCKPEIYDRWSDKLNLFPTGRVWVDCVMPDISKGNAMKKISELLSIRPEESIAFGDNMNDIPMIQFAGTGYAVDNARIEVREAADKIIPGYASDGVLQLLKSICNYSEPCR